MAPSPSQGQDSSAGGSSPEGRASTLARALGDPKCITRYEAAKALGGLGPAAAPWVSNLAETISDNERIVRCAAAGAIGSLAAKGSLAAQTRQTASTALLKALKDSSPWVRRAAAAALGSLCTSLDGEGQSQGCKVEGGLGLETVLALVRTLQDEDEGVRHAVSDALKALDENSSNMLIQALDDKDVRVRTTALHGIVALGPSPEVYLSALAKKLKDPHGSVRKAAAEALGKLGPAAASQALALGQSLRDCDPGVRCAAVETLKVLGDAGAEILADGLGSPDELARRGGAEALAQLGSDAAPHAAALAEALRDPSLHVKKAAAKALGALGPDASLHVASLAEMLQQDQDGETQCAAAAALVELGEVGTQVVFQALSNGNEQLRCGCAAVGVMDRLVPYTPDDLALRNKMLQDRNWVVRIGACSSLTNVSTASSRQGPPPDFFINAFIDGDVRMRRSAVGVIGEVGGMQNETVLERALSDTAWSVRVKAAEALGKIGTRNGMHLVRSLQTDASEAVRFAAAQALLALGPAVTKPHAIALIEALKDPDENVRCEVSRILWAIGPGLLSHASALVLKLSESSASTRREAASVLRCLGSNVSVYASAIAHVFSIEKDPDVRRELAITLQFMNPEETDKLVNAKLVQKAIEGPTARVTRSVSLGPGRPLLAKHWTSSSRLHEPVMRAVPAPRAQAIAQLQLQPGKPSASMPQLPLLNLTPRGVAGVSLTPRSMDGKTPAAQGVSVIRSPTGISLSAQVTPRGGYTGQVLSSRIDALGSSVSSLPTLALHEKLQQVRPVVDAVALKSPRAGAGTPRVGAAQPVVDALTLKSPRVGAALKSPRVGAAQQVVDAVTLKSPRLG